MQYSLKTMSSIATKCPTINNFSRKLSGISFLIEKNIHLHNIKSANYDRGDQHQIIRTIVHAL